MRDGACFTLHMQYRYTDKPKCSQCLTAGGKALTLVCVIDYATNKVVYDLFVKLPSPITDYLTRCVSQLMALLFAL